MVPHKTQPDDHRDQPSSDDQDEILEIDLSDEADDADILVVELDDEPSAGLPPVDGNLMASAQALELPAVCALTRAGFAVTVLPRPDGYDVVGARPADFKTAVPATGGQTLQGVFHLSDYPGCPHCHAEGLILCETCGTVSCSAADPKSGMLLPCPVCGNAGPVGQSKKGWSVKAFGGKGKKGKPGP